MRFYVPTIMLFLSICLNSSLLISMEETKPLETSMEYGVATLQGRRKSMEDAHAIQVPFLESDPTSAFFAIYDGHGGKAVAEHCATTLHTQVQKAFLECGNMKEALVKGIEETDKALTTSDYQGCTAVIAIIKDKKLYIAHVGDSRAILARNSKAILLTVDHIPDNPKEKARIIKAGGTLSENQFVDMDGVKKQIAIARVEGLLAITRAIGDHHLRNKGVIPTPEVVAISLCNEDEFLILACDGVFDKNILSVDAAASVVYKALDDHKSSCKSAEKAAQLLVSTAFTAGSTDNITALVVNLQQNSKREKSDGLCLEADEYLPSTQETDQSKEEFDQSQQI